MRIEKVKEILERFALKVIAEAKLNLQRDNKNVSSNLSKSLSHEFDEDEQGFILRFLGAKYGKYVDKGVRGAINPYSGKDAAQKPFDKKTVYAYTDKMPPPSKLDKWIVRRGLAPRERGKFTARRIDTAGFQKSIQFLVARSIYSKGIKASMFFTKPFQKYVTQLEKEIFTEFDVSIENIFKK
jgi:hypothetical protein